MRKRFVWILCLLSGVAVPSVGSAAEPTPTPMGTAALTAPPATPTVRPTQVPGNFLLNEILVTANRLGVPARQVASSYTVLTEEDLERGQRSSVAEALRTVPALDVVNTGGPGKTTSFDLRGAGSDRTLVFIDGVEVNDPMSTGRTFNAANLTVDNVGRIEVLRGPQSALYGPEAVGGVIQIFTQRGQGPLRVRLLEEGGSYGEFRSSIGASGGNPRFDYSASLSHLGLTGFPIAPPDPTQLLPMKSNGYLNNTASLRAGWLLAPWLNLNGVARYDDGRSSLDNGSAIRNDPNYDFLTRQSTVRLEAAGKLLDGHWETTLGASRALNHMEDRNNPDLDHPFDFLRDFYSSRVDKIDWLNHFHLPNNILTAGFESQEESGNSSTYSESLYGPYSDAFDRETSRMNGWFLQDQASWKDRLYLSAGARLDRHDLYGQQVTWRLAPAWILSGTDTKLKATWGTGWKVPSLYQRFSPYGNPGLSPETSHSWDAGLEQPLLGHRLVVGATYFHSRYDDFIDFDNVNFVYLNYHRVGIQGTELTGNYRLPREGALRSAFTWTDSRNLDTGEPLPRRAVRQASFSGDSPRVHRIQVGLDLRWVGPRSDILFPPWPDVAHQVPLPDYWVTTVRVDWKPSTKVSFYGRVENLSNRRYEEVLGYETAKRSFYLGTRVEL